MQRYQDEIQAKLAAIEAEETQAAAEKILRAKRKAALLQEKQLISIDINKALREACQRGEIATIQSLLSEGADIHSCEGDYYAPIDQPNSKKWMKYPFAGDAIHNAIRGDQPEALLLLINHLVKILKNPMETFNDNLHKYKTEIGPIDEVLLQSKIANIHDLTILCRQNHIQMPCITGRINSLLIEAVLTNSEKCISRLLKAFSTVDYRRVVYGYKENNTRETREDKLNQLKMTYLDGSTFLIADKSVDYEHSWFARDRLYFGNDYKSFQRELSSEESQDIINALKSCSFIHDYLQERVSYDPRIITKIIKLFNLPSDNLTRYDIRYVSGNMTDYTQKGDALSLAIDLGYNNIAKSLIESGCSLEEKYGNRETKSLNMWSSRLEWDHTRDLTPLLVAAGKNNKEIVQLLLEKGADVHANDRTGKTAYDLATDPLVRSILLEYQNQTNVLHTKTHNLS